MNGPDSLQRTTVFTGKELRLVERAARRHGYRSLPAFIHDAALHFSAHRSDVRRPRSRGEIHQEQERSAGPASTTSAPDGLAGLVSEELAFGEVAIDPTGRMNTEGHRNPAA